MGPKTVSQVYVQPQATIIVTGCVELFIMEANWK